MKLKFTLLLAFVVTAATLFAQTSNLRRGKSSYNRFNEVKSLGNPSLGINDLNAAKNALDKAIEHEKTNELAETWTYYGLVYADLAVIDSFEVADGFAEKAAKGRERAIALDTNNENKENIGVLNSLLAQHELNKGIRAWEKQDFESSYTSFDRGLTYLPNDTTFLYYAGLAAINTQQYQKAISKYVDLTPIDSFSNNKQIILDVSRLYMMEGDTLNAIKYAELGAAKYPEDAELATQNIELNLMAGNDEKVINTITGQISKDPSNKTLHYYLGIAYSATGDNDGAAKAYQDALKIDANYLDANINLGGIILNKGIDQFNSANQGGLSNEEYNAAVKKAHEIFDSALPYLSKAVEIDGNSVLALSNLQRYYEIKDNEEKVKEIQARIEAIR